MNIPKHKHNALTQGLSVVLSTDMLRSLEPAHNVYSVRNLDRVGILDQWVVWIEIEGRSSDGDGRCFDYSRRDDHCVGRATYKGGCGMSDPIKRIGYAYASSPYADQCGCPDGCYIIEDTKPLIPVLIEGGYPNWQAAKDAADDMPGEYDRWSMDSDPKEVTA